MFRRIQAPACPTFSHRHRFFAARRTVVDQGASQWPWPAPATTATFTNAGGHPAAGSAAYEQLRANWAENVRFDHSTLIHPSDTFEVQKAVAAHERIAVVGSGHSFGDMSRVAKGGALLSTASLTHIGPIDTDSMTVTVGAGTTLGNLSRHLLACGAALPNVPSPPQITVAGACFTGTHGTGAGFPSMAANIASLEVVTADGSVHRLRRGHDDLFRAAATSLGCLGVVTEIEMDIVPEFCVHTRAYGGIPLEPLLSSGAVHDAFNAADNVGAFIDFGSDTVELMFVRDRVPPSDDNSEKVPPMPDPPTEAYGGHLVSHDIKCFESHIEVGTTGAGTWPERLFLFLDRNLRDIPMPTLALHTEHFVAAADLIPALQAVRQVAKHWPGWGTWDGKNPTSQGVAHICELRSIGWDDIWLSPCTGRDESFSIHFTFGNYPTDVYACLGELETALEPFAARPHWGKLWRTCPIDLYPMAEQFKEARAVLDPHGKFLTQFARRALNI